LFPTEIGETHLELKNSIVKKFTVKIFGGYQQQGKFLQQIIFT